MRQRSRQSGTIRENTDYVGARTMRITAEVATGTSAAHWARLQLLSGTRNSDRQGSERDRKRPLPQLVECSSLESERP
jgi:hypothetical protein